MLKLDCFRTAVSVLSDIVHKYRGLEDPSGKPAERLREIRDQIETRAKVLLSELLQEKG